MSLKFQTDAGLMNAQIKIKKIQRNFNDYGFSITLKKIISNLIKPIYENRTYRIYRLELDKFNNLPSNETFIPKDENSRSVSPRTSGNPVFNYGTDLFSEKPHTSLQLTKEHENTSESPRGRDVSTFSNRELPLIPPLEKGGKGGFERLFSTKTFVFKTIDKNDANIIKQIEDMEEWLQGKVDSMLEDGGLCLVALDGEKVAGFNLVSFGEVFIPLINYTRKLKHNEAWSSQITVNKNYRRNGLGTALRHRIIEKLRKRGIEKLYGGTLIANEPNLKLSRKVGFREIVDVQYSKILNKESLRYKRVKKD